MTKLSVNINKIATLRNSRGGNNPNLVNVALDCERFGAQGITVHPRPDERHIRYQDVIDLKPIVTNAYNAYKAGKLTKIGYDGYLCPAEKMQLTQNSKHYTFALVISNMNGGFERREQSLDNFNFEGYLLIKKR